MPRGRRLDRARQSAYVRPMTRIFDLDEHVRLPWRFYGAMRAILASRARG